MAFVGSNVTVPVSVKPINLPNPEDVNQVPEEISPVKLEAISYPMA